jgi:hypothetical protein
VSIETAPSITKPYRELSGQTLAVPADNTLAAHPLVRGE